MNRTQIRMRALLPVKPVYSPLEKKEIAAFSRVGKVQTKAGEAVALCSQEGWNDALYWRMHYDADIWLDKWAGLEDTAYYLSFDDTTEDFRASCKALAKELK